jgi:hypothetical protein
MRMRPAGICFGKTIPSARDERLGTIALDLLRLYANTALFWEEKGRIEAQEGFETTPSPRSKGTSASRGERLGTIMTCRCERAEDPAQVVAGSGFVTSFRPLLRRGVLRESAMRRPSPSEQSPVDFFFAGSRVGWEHGKVPLPSPPPFGTGRASIPNGGRGKAVRNSRRLHVDAALWHRS